MKWEYKDDSNIYRIGFIIAIILAIILMLSIFNNGFEKGYASGQEKASFDCKKVLANDYLLSGQERKQNTACKDLVYCLNNTEKCINEGKDNNWALQQNQICLGN